MIRCQHMLAIVAFVCIALLPDCGEAIHCWVCSSDTDPRCGNPFNISTNALGDCSRASHSAFLYPVCKKQVHRYMDTGEVVIVRSCAWSTDSSNDDGPCHINTKPNVRIEYCSTCEQDFCNAAATIGSTMFLTILLAITIKLIPNIF
ncbi:uncharacterized protein LOC126901093 [Daktulosphaira vitifoliae]|uniref:uncharacterized protein LOC126901093 n=1 Tax=Daktulosphaira vitifoliae TaxID=58002 RepID=UPI0021A9E695|nr:uncharacterized protein LOC126901093 [Daktulosphaira vitifoliae]